MATLLTHVYYIQNILNRGMISDDTLLSNRLIAHTLKQVRARLLKMKLDKKDYMSDYNYQKICIPLDLFPFHNCECIEDLDECLLLRSVNTLPEPIVAKWGTTLQILTLGGKKIPMSTITSNSYADYSLSSKDKISFFPEENHIFIQNNKKLKMVLGKAIFVDPDIVIQFMNNVCDSDSSCKKYYSEEFPIDPELVEVMYEMTIKDLASTYGFVKDDKNDSRAPEQVQALDPNENQQR